VPIFAKVGYKTFEKWVKGILSSIVITYGIPLKKILKATIPGSFFDWITNNLFSRSGISASATMAAMK
jgi:hypothetical protein